MAQEVTIAATTTFHVAKSRLTACSAATGSNRSRGLPLAANRAVAPGTRSSITNPHGRARIRTAKTYANGELIEWASGPSRRANGAAVISGDGTRVVYISTAADIVAESGSGVTYDIFLYDRNTGMTRRLSTPPLTGNTGFAETSISGDGLRVAYRLGPQYSREMFRWADCAILNPTCGDNALEPHAVPLASERPCE